MLQQLGIPTYELCINIYNQNPPNIDRYDITVDGDSQNADSGRYDQLEYIRDIAEGSIVEIGLNGVTDYMLDFPKEYVTDEYERRPPYRLEGVTEKRLFVRYDDPYVIRIIMK